jgi:hypothetical protein
MHDKFVFSFNDLDINGYMKVGVDSFRLDPTHIRGLKQENRDKKINDIING